METISLRGFGIKGIAFVFGFVIYDLICLFKLWVNHLKPAVNAIKITYCTQNYARNITQRFGEVIAPWGTSSLSLIFKNAADLEMNKNDK